MVLGAATILTSGFTASAQQIEAPAGCTAFLTVQSKECRVSHYWRCEGDDAGDTWHASYDAGGPVSFSHYDKDFQWLDAQNVRDATRDILVEPAEDPASMTELLETGRDTYDFVIREEGPRGTREIRHKGFDELSGQTAVIDGQELLITLFSATASDADTGDEIYSVVGQQYVLAEERLFFLGRDTFSQDGRQITSDGSPLQFLRPGERGFGNVQPAFECNDPTDISYWDRVNE